MERIREICKAMIDLELDHVESQGKHIYRTENMWIYTEGSTPMVGSESLEIFLKNIEMIYEGV